MSNSLSLPIFFLIWLHFPCIIWSIRITTIGSNITMGIALRSENKNMPKTIIFHDFVISIYLSFTFTLQLCSILFSRTTHPRDRPLSPHLKADQLWDPRGTTRESLHLQRNKFRVHPVVKIQFYRCKLELIKNV